MQPSRSIEEREGLCTMFTWGIYKLGTPSSFGIVWLSISGTIDP